MLPHPRRRRRYSNRPGRAETPSPPAPPKGCGSCVRGRLLRRSLRLRRRRSSQRQLCLCIANDQWDVVARRGSLRRSNLPLTQLPRSRGQVFQHAQRERGEKLSVITVRSLYGGPPLSCWVRGKDFAICTSPVLHGRLPPLPLGEGRGEGAATRGHTLMWRGRLARVRREASNLDAQACQRTPRPCLGTRSREAAPHLLSTGADDAP